VENRKTQAFFRCVLCGFEENADVAGAINILARGRRVAACGEMAPPGRSMKQEPAEATRSGNAARNERRRNPMPLSRGGCHPLIDLIPVKPPLVADPGSGDFAALGHAVGCNEGRGRGKIRGWVVV